jgi:hypothetical protein
MITYIFTIDYVLPTGAKVITYIFDKNGTLGEFPQLCNYERFGI